ncbi:hypothetical protein M758_3G140600 [Ceratodon purpureus]|nr:hypothetical protein M758_3G140600 [Ceratodon purpureus]
MATLSQLHLAGAAASGLQFRRNSAVVRNSLISSQLIRGGVLPLKTVICSRREVVARVGRLNVEVVEDGESEVALAQEESEGFLSRLPLKGVEAGLFAAAGVFLDAAGPAHALIIDEEEVLMRFSPEAWVNIYIATGVWVVLYFLVIPLVVYNYLRLRWYKRTFAETYFQFLLVFLFFPGMLLLAPFINFRALPQDGAEEP